MSAEFALPSAIRTLHRVVRVLIIVDRKHWNQHVKMGGFGDAASGRILRGFRYRLADWDLHLVGIGPGQNPVEVQVEFWLIHAVKILQVRESD